jgi:hypothetical protein
MAMLSGQPAWFGRPTTIRDDVTEIRSARLRQHASIAKASRNAARIDEFHARPQDEMQQTLPALFVLDARRPKMQAALAALRGVGYDIVPFDVSGEWEGAYRNARAANPGERVIMMGWGAKGDRPALGYICTGTEGGDVAAMTLFEPMKGMSLFGRMRCRTFTRLLRLKGTWVDYRATCTIERWRELPAHMRRQWAPREGLVVSRRGEEASAFLERITVAEIERQVRMMERAGKVHILA